MSNNSKWMPFLVIAVVVILAFVGGRFFYYGSASAYTPPQNRDLKGIEFEAAASSPRLEAVDNPTISRGVVVIDYSHRNAFFIEELNVLLSKIVTRGFNYEIVSASADEEEGNDLASKLRYAKALILPLPRAEYSDQEIAEIERFVEKGGKVLIIGDPTRTVIVESLNSIAGSFGIVYNNDYIYSLDHNDNNYRNVVYTNFKDSPITKGLDEDSKVIFYSGSSLSAPGDEIILGDETTHSSVSEGGRAMVSAALTTHDQVLALGDMTFLTEPYSNAESNGTLINNIADFLADGQRSFDLKDFPYFFNPNVDVVFDNTLVFNSQFEDSVKMKERLEEAERTVTFTDKIGGNDDIIFVGRFDDTKMVDEYLAAADISLIKQTEESPEKLALATEEAQSSDTVALVNATATNENQDQGFIEGRIKIGGMGELERGGSTLFYLYQAEGRNILIILSDNPDTNADAFDLLLKGDYADCLASPTIAVCQTEQPDKRQLPSVRSTRIDKILVVADDNARKRTDAQTSVVEYRNVLSATYKVDTWFTSDGKGLDLNELQQYDAIIWTTGDYWDDSIGEEDTQLLTEYIEAGGNLIMSGASIGFDWDHTDFLTNIAHADYLTFAEQKDLEVALVGHPIAKGFEEGDVITFVDTPSGEKLEPDVVNHTPNARVIFRRGPDSKQAGAASVIAYEDDRSKIAYFAFPFYLLPPDAQSTLVNNTIDWFTRKSLGLPDEKDFKPFVSNGEEEGTPTPTDQTDNNGGDNNGSGGDNGGENNGDQGNGNGNSGG